MFEARYRFVSNWRIPEATCNEVADVLEDLDTLPRWWPSVYLDITPIRSGEEHGLHRIVDLYTKGWLPYTLRWRLEIVEVDYPRSSRVAATGDLTGSGRWQFTQDGPDVAIRYDWEVEAGKPLLRYGSPVLRPLFAANHRWAMARGEESLRREVRRRQAEREGRPFEAPPPPGPTFFRRTS